MHTLQPMLNLVHLNKKQLKQESDFETEVSKKFIHFTMLFTFSLCALWTLKNYCML